MKKILATTLLAFALATPAMAFDINSIEGIPSDIKDSIAKQSGGRITNKQGQQDQQQAGQDGQQQQGGRQRKQRLSKQDRAMQQAEQFMNGGGNGGGFGGQGIGQGVGSFR